MDKSQSANPVPAETDKTAAPPASGPNADTASSSEPPKDTAAEKPAEGDQETTEETTPAPPAPKPAEAPPPVKSNKIKALIIKALPIIIVIVLMAVSAFAGYYFGTKKGGAKSTDQNASAEIAIASEDPNESSSSADASTAPLVPPCISGFQPYTNESFSICVPKTMIPVEEGIETEEGNGKKYTYEDDVQTLTVLTDYQENLNKPTCATIKVVKVSGFQAQRYQIKDAGKTEGSCASTIRQYATLVSSGPDKPLFYISLQKKEGSFQSDNGTFVSIDQSFRLNK